MSENTIEKKKFNDVKKNLSHPRLTWLICDSRYEIEIKNILKKTNLKKKNQSYIRKKSQNKPELT